MSNYFILTIHELRCKHMRLKDQLKVEKLVHKYSLNGIIKSNELKFVLNYYTMKTF
jgi:hypothetical protein